MEEKLLVSPSPHLRGSDTTQKIMLDVIIALCPTAAASVVLFGWRALLLEVICIAGCVLAEFICRKVMKRPNTIGDLSAVVTGLLLAFNLPVTIHPAIALIGCAVAIVVVKQMFGGVGQNFMNPALTARVVLMVSFPAAMTNWIMPFYYRTGTLADALTTATPLALTAAGNINDMPGTVALFFGAYGGCIGETCSLALLIGFLYLLIRRVITPVIPVCFVGTVALFTWLLGGDPLTAVLSGGVLLGAIFMATDYTTSPLTGWGKVIFGIGCGLLTVLIRRFGSLPEGASFSILLMNILVPHIERLTRPRAFGSTRKKKAGAAK